MKHSRNINLGNPGTKLVQCPDCGQMEVWTEDETLYDHGQCRALPEGAPCEACEPEENP